MDVTNSPEFILNHLETRNLFFEAVGGCFETVKNVQKQAELWLYLVRDREVDGSNPFAPTFKINNLGLLIRSLFILCPTYCPT
jgi:hypothetical protein